MRVIPAKLVLCYVEGTEIQSSRTMDSVSELALSKAERVQNDVHQS